MLISQVQSDSDSLRFSSALWSGRSPSQGSGPASQACWSPVPVLTSDRDVFTFHSSPDQQTFMSDRDLLSDGIEKRFWRLIRIFSLFLKGFLSVGLNRRTGHSSLSRLFTLSSLGGERQNTNTKARSRGKQAAITGETPKINYTAPPANSLLFFAINYTAELGRLAVVWGRNVKSTKHTQRLVKPKMEPKHTITQWFINIGRMKEAAAALKTGNQVFTR